MQPVLQSNSELALWATLHLIWIIVFLASNVILMLNITRQIRRRQRICSVVLTLSLIVSQILIGFIVLPAAVAGLFSTAYGNSVLCKLYRYASLVSSVACAATLVALIVVTRKEAISGRLSPCHIGGIVSAVWVVSLVYGTRAYVVNDVIRTDDVVRCAVDSRYEGTDTVFSAVDAVIMFLLPACVLFWLYVVLAKAASSVVHNVGTTAECSRGAGRNRQPTELSKPANGTTSGWTSQCTKRAVASEDNRQLGDARTATLSNDSTGVQRPGDSGGVSDTYVTGKTVAVSQHVNKTDAVGEADNPAFNEQTTDARDRNTGTKHLAVNARGNAKLKVPKTSKEATGVNDNMTGKLHMLTALVACFMLTNSAPYAWQIVRYLSDSDRVHDNYQHIDLAVYLFSYSYAWLYAFIILYYYRSVFPVNPTLP